MLFEVCAFAVSCCVISITSQPFIDNATALFGSGMRLCQFALIVIPILADEVFSEVLFSVTVIII